MTPPSATGVAYDFRSSIRPRMYGSSDRYCTRNKICPALGVGMAVSSRRKLLGFGRPCGRAARTIWRAFTSVISIPPYLVFRNEIDFQSGRWRIDVEYIDALTTSAGLPNASIWIAFKAAPSTDVEFSAHSLNLSPNMGRPLFDD